MGRSYYASGYALIRDVISREIATAFLVRMKSDLARQGLTLEKLEKSQPLLTRPAAELYGFHYVPLATFHWGLTPAIERAINKALIPSYAYFRLYREGDVCHVHADRQACEHSLSLTLAYSDERPWPLQIAMTKTAPNSSSIDAAFKPDEKLGIAEMMPGDGVIYQGIRHRHGRTIPNPNRWSAHAFFHWVEKGGENAEHAFDGNKLPKNVAF